MNDLLNVLDDLSKRRIEEQLMLSMGQMPVVTADTLLGYAYMNTSTVKARLTLDRDAANNMANPVFIYDIEIKEKKRYMLAQWGLKKGTFWGKLLCLLMIRFGAPMSLAEYVRSLASSILPPTPPYRVKVNIHAFPLDRLPLPSGLEPVRSNSGLLQ